MKTEPSVSEDTQENQASQLPGLILGLLSPVIWFIGWGLIIMYFSIKQNRY